MRDSAAAGLPPINVTPRPGQAVDLQMPPDSGARNILEIGTLGGYSTIWLGPRSSPEEARDHARGQREARLGIAGANIARAGPSLMSSSFASGRPAERFRKLAAGAGTARVRPGFH